ncbi:MAG: glycine betaine ABC transporter substrate-binding protein [Dehalococcoidales bacterium]
MKHKLIFSLVVLVLVLSLIIPGCAQPKAEKHVIFGTGAWSGDWLEIYVPKILLEEQLGYTTEIADLSVPGTWAAMAAGEVDLWTNAWFPNQAGFAAEHAATTEWLDVVYGTAHSPDDVCLQFWAIPTWVAEETGITSVADLKDPKFAELFDVDGDGIGDVLGCDAAWKCAEMIDEEIVEYGLEGMYEQKYGAEAMMMAAIEGHLMKNEPVLFYLYTPHPFFVDFPIGESIFILEDPLNIWGGKATVYKFGNADWVAANPEAANIIRQMRFTSNDIAWSMKEIEEKGDAPETLEAMAREWMSEHQDDVNGWLKEALEQEG